MIDITTENFTAQEALTAGLGDAIARGEVKVSGTYEVTKSAGMTFNQRTFTFRDRAGDLRSGRFKNSAELERFGREFQKNGYGLAV